MMIQLNRKTHRTLLRLGATAFLIAAMTVAGNTIGESASSCALPPREWDIADYDACVADAEDNWVGTEADWEALNQAYEACCKQTGGVWNGQNCAAPPARGGRHPTW